MYCVAIHLYLLLLINLSSKILYFFRFPFFSIHMVCAGRNHSSAGACCFCCQEYEHTTTDKGDEVAWFTTSYKRSQILTSRYFVGSKLTGFNYNSKCKWYYKDFFPLPSSKWECTNTLHKFFIYLTSTVSELNNEDSWRRIYIMKFKKLFISDFKHKEFLEY